MKVVIKAPPFHINTGVSLRYIGSVIFYVRKESTHTYGPMKSPAHIIEIYFNPFIDSPSIFYE